MNINLNKFGAGHQLIQKVINSRQKGMPWSVEKQQEIIDKRKNPHTNKTRKNK